MRSSEWQLKYTLGGDGAKRPRSWCPTGWKYQCKGALASHRQLKICSNKIPAKEYFKKDSIIWYPDICFYLSTYPSLSIFLPTCSLFWASLILLTPPAPCHRQSCRRSTPALVASAFMSPSFLKPLLLLVYCHWFWLRLQLFSYTLCHDLWKAFWSGPFWREETAPATPASGALARG